MRRSIAITTINILARGSTLLLFLLIGNHYGATATTDTIFLLYAPFAVGITVIAGIAEIVLLPMIHRAAASGCAISLQRLMIRRAIVFTLILSPGFALTALLLAHDLTFVVLILLPLPALATLTSFSAGLLNAAGRFRVAAIGPVYGTLTATVTMMVLPGSSLALAATLLAYEMGRMFGTSYHARSLLFATPDQNTVHAHALLKGATQAARLQGLGSMLVAVNPVVDMMFASTLGPGGVTSVEYANRLWIVLPLLFSGHLMTFHADSSLAASQDRLHAHHTRAAALRLGIAAVLIGAVLASMSGWLIALLFSLGNMEESAKSGVASLFGAYLIGAGPYVASLVFIKALSARNKVDIILRGAAISVIANVVLDWLLIGPLGLFGLGLATSMCYLIMAIYTYRHCR